MMVFSLWAMVSTVHSRNFSRMVRWISSSVLRTKITTFSLEKRLRAVEHYSQTSGDVITNGFSSHLWSTLAVASSIMRMRFLRRIARARHTSCLWPRLKFEPDSASTVSSRPGNSSTTAFSWTCVENTVNQLIHFRINGENVCMVNNDWSGSNL